MPMQDFVSKFAMIMPDVKLPPGFPPQRVFSTLDVNKNRALEPAEMKNMRSDIQKMLLNHEHNPDKPPGAANPAPTKDRRAGPSPEEREKMKKDAMERAEKARAEAKTRAKGPGVYADLRDLSQLPPAVAALISPAVGSGRRSLLLLQEARRRRRQRARSSPWRSSSSAPSSAPRTKTRTTSSTG
jgi:hypothetical protein